MRTTPERRRHSATLRGLKTTPKINHAKLTRLLRRLAKTGTLRRMRHRLALAPLILATACADSTLTTAPSLLARDANGATANLAAITSAHVVYEQDRLGSTRKTADGLIVNGRPSVEIRVADANAPISMRLELHDVNGVALVGGTPWIPVTGASEVPITVGVPGTCVVVPDLALGTARDSASAVLLGQYVLVSGGTEASGPSSAVERFDLTTNTRTAMPPAATPLGPAYAVFLDRAHALVLSDGRPGYIQSVLSMDAVLGRVEPPLHEGAERARQLGVVQGSNSVVIGGGTLASPSHEVSFVVPGTNAVYVQTLPTATPDVIGGAGVTGAWAMAFTGSTAKLFHVTSGVSSVFERIPSYNDGLGTGRERHGAQMLIDPTGFRMLVVGGTDENGVLRTDTILVRDCPVNCFASAGPTWTNARVGATFDRSGIVVGGDVPSTLVERITLPPGAGVQPVMETFATLTIPRSRPAVAALPSGPVLVMGGVGSSGQIAETELCFPPD